VKLTAHTDGASKGNPGPAAIGYTIEKDGIVLEERSRYIGDATNNVAEYRALIAALRRMKELGATEVVIYSDSELVVRHINGLYKVKSRSLKPLYLEVMSLLGNFRSHRVVHVTRDYNSVADGLANKAIKEHKKRKKRRETERAAGS